jgi:hypothetical protein
MHKWLKIRMLVLAIAMSGAAIAQDVDIADKEGLMRSSGKIYVVLAIVLTILAGLIIYVVRLDRKISRLEKNDV